MAPVAIIACREVSKTYGERPLFRDLSFTVHEGERVGLIGPNGAGKSTLLKILAGQTDPDQGEVVRRKGLRSGYVPQHPVFRPGLTALEVVARASAGAGRNEQQEDWTKASISLQKTGFQDHDVPAAVLSGGWRTRLAVASALAREPEILLLDEPTNHLDIESTLWLESFLVSESIPCIVISHDRYFLQNTATRILEIDPVYPEGIFSSQGTYADFLERRERFLAGQASYRESLANQVRREIAWLRSGVKARTTKSRARIQAAEKSIEELREIQARSAARTAGIEMTSGGRRTKRLWYCKGLAKRFGETRVLDDLELLLKPGMRLGVLGFNGTGKTTFLKIIAGELEPDAGTVRPADHLHVVYFDQTRESLDPRLTLKQALAPEGDTVVYRGRSLHVISWAKRFLFRPEQLELEVSRLSGGEQARIVLARMMLRPADLLVLDEPTNDLDIPTLEILEESLLEFPGALVMVTHDRHLIDRVASEVLALDGKGGAARFADYRQWVAARTEPETRKAKRSAEGGSGPEATSRLKPKPKKLSYMEQREWDRMGDAILEAEARLEAVRERLADPSIATDGTALQARMEEVEAARTEVDRLYERWAELEEKQDPTNN